MSIKGSVCIILIALAALSSACKGKTGKAEETMVASGIEISIQGMTCTGCEQTIQASITKLDGVKSVKASFQTGKAVVEYIPSLVDTLKMREAVSGAGYVVKGFTALPAGAAPMQ